MKTQLGIVKRMMKEVASYEKEVVTNEARVQKMRDEGRDAYGNELVTVTHIPSFLTTLYPHTTLKYKTFASRKRCSRKVT